MSVEFIGFIGNNNSSETTPRSGPLARCHTHRDLGEGA